jgi:hypothetical protein
MERFASKRKQQMNRLKTASFGRGSEAAAQICVARIIAGG